MHLLVVTQYFWPEEFRINDLVGELRARGHTITVLTGVPNYPWGTVFPEFAADPARFATYEGVEVIRVPMLPRGSGALRLMLNYASFALSATVFGLSRLSGRRFDGIFVFEPSPVTVGLPAIAIKAVHGWPIVFWVLDQWPESLAAVGMVRSPSILRAVGLGVRFIYTRCDAILSPSKRLMPQIASYCRPGQRIEYFPNWSEAVFEGPPPAPASDVPSAPGVFTVMFAGNIGDAQDFPAILDAAERLKARADIRWLIVGDGRSSAWVREEIARRGLEERVHLLGRMPVDRMPAVFQHADALLVSLRADAVFAMTSPGKIQSYLATGIPVLAMLDGEGAAVIEEAQAGYTSPAGDSARLAANIERLSALASDARAALGANGLAFARREFRRELLVDRLEQCFTDLIAPGAVREAQ